jgi:hypothetical protein
MRCRFIPKIIVHANYFSDFSLGFLEEPWTLSKCYHWKHWQMLAGFLAD